jgi:hypothetical protein
MKKSVRIKSAKYFLRSFSIITGFLFIALSSASQSRWQAGLRGAANFPTNNLSSTELKTGFGLEGTIAYRFMPHLSAFAGWGWNQFTPKASFSKVDFEETGYSFGLQFLLPIAKSRISYLVSGGAIYNHIETEDENGNVIDDSGHGWGWQAESGLSITICPRLSIQPTLRYRSLAREINKGDGATAVDLRYISAGAGLQWKFLN